MKIAKKILIVVLIIFVIIIIGLFTLIKLSEILAVVNNNYYDEVKAVRELEAKYTQNGDFHVDYIEYTSVDASIGKYKVWYPSIIESEKTTYPVVIMANGTGVPASKYEAIFNHLASWRFIVVGNEDNESWDGSSSSKSLDYIIALNEDRNSIFYKKINTDAIGIAGHSQGGVGAINASTNFENSGLFKSIYTASTPHHELTISLKWKYDVSKINIPYFMTAGDGKFDSETITPLSSLEENFKVMPYNVIKIMARRKNTDHSQMLANADGYMTAWFLYTLTHNTEATMVFSGDSPELLNNSDNWQDIVINNID